jgi:hypothetical protein
MPEDGWTSLTVGEHVGAMIKALARSRGLTVSGYFEGLMAAGRELEVGEEGWMECSICSARLKAKDVPEHILRCSRRTLTVNHTIA